MESAKPIREIPYWPKHISHRFALTESSKASVRQVLVYSLVVMLLAPAMILLPRSSPEQLVQAQPPDFAVSWELVRDGIIHKVFEIEVQNLLGSGRTVSFDVLFSDASFPIEDLQNVRFYEWKTLQTTIEVVDYDNVPYENVPIYDNEHNIIGYENQWRWEVVGSHLENRLRNEWKRSKMQWFERTANTYKESMGEITIPKFGSKPKYDNYGDIETENGKKTFKLEFDAPIHPRVGGWGSSGLVRLGLDNTLYGSDYVGQPGSSWWDENWQYCKRIEIDQTKVMNENFDNFPVLFYLSSDSDLAARAMDNGGDIAFVNSDNTVQFDHELENFNGATGELTAFFRVPTLYDNENTIIWMYYGNASAANQENVCGVWDANFKGVWHMADDRSEWITEKWAYTYGGTGGFDGENYWATIPNQYNTGQMTHFTYFATYGTYTWTGIHEYDNSTQGFTMQGFKNDLAAPNNAYIAFEHWYDGSEGDNSVCRAMTRLGAVYNIYNVWEEEPPGENWKTPLEYKIIWSEDNATFYIDNVFIVTFTTNVPSEGNNLYFYTGAGCGTAEDPPGTSITSTVRDVNPSARPSFLRISDSSSDNNDGIKASENNPIEVDGKIWKAQDFSSDYITTFSDYSTSDNEPVTVEVWVYPDSTCDDYNVFASYAATGDEQWTIMAGLNETYTDNWIIYMPDSGYLYGSHHNLNQWYHFVMVFDGTYVRGYVDGSLDIPNTASSYTGDSLQLTFGRWYTDYDGFYFPGKIDELRVSEIARSAGWISTTFNNENDPASFYSVGGEESVVAWQLIETWTGTIEAYAEWNLIETWTGTIENPEAAIWNLIETWTGTVEAPAEWQLIETWTGTIEAYAEWNLIETWTGTVKALGWSCIEVWSGTIKAPTANTPPTKPTLVLTPATIYVTTELWAAASSTDGEGDPITYYFKFYNVSDATTRQDWSTDNFYVIQQADAHNTMRVYAKASDGQENSQENSADKSVANSAPSAPAMTSNLGMNETNHNPTVTWSKGGDADGDTVNTYVYVGTSPSPTTEEDHNTGTSLEIGYTVTLSDGQTYYARLRSHDGSTYSGYTSDDEFRMNTPPTTTSPLCEGLTNPSSVDDRTPDFAWTYGDTESDAQSHWQIYVGTSVGVYDMWDSGQLSGTDTSDVYAGINLDNNFTYYWQVRTKDAYELSGWATGTFTTYFTSEDGGDGNGDRTRRLTVLILDNETDDPIEGVIVELHLYGSLVESGYTRWDGTVGLDINVQGVYDLRWTKAGYQDEVMEIELSVSSSLILWMVPAEERPLFPPITWILAALVVGCVLAVLVYYGSDKKAKAASLGTAFILPVILLGILWFAGVVG